MFYAFIIIVIVGSIGGFMASCRKKEAWIDKVATTTHDPELIARQVDLAVAEMKAEASETQRRIDEVNHRNLRF